MKYDMIVIGLGPAGMALTVMGSKLGLKVLAIENQHVGGECLNCGCIPSKGILKSASVCFLNSKCEKFGLDNNSIVKVNKPFQRMSKYVDYVIKNIAEPKLLDATHIMSKGYASLVDKHTVEVDGRKYFAKRIYIATGTEPFIPPIPGIQEVEYLTNQNLFKISKIPKSMFIIGAGAIGCEMAQAFTRLGTKVTMIHNGHHVIPLCDEESAKLLEAELIKEGVDLFNDSKILNIQKVGTKIRINTDKGHHVVDELLVATGRRPCLEHLNLDKVGVKHNPHGIEVDEQCKTSVKNIFAVGDCNGRGLFSHAAMHQGLLALTNSFPLMRTKIKNYHVPWSVFTDPEVAQVGFTEKQLQDKGVKYEVIKVLYSEYARAITDEATTGYVKVLSSKMGKVYGATIVGEAASELIHEWILVIQNNIRLYKILYTMHSFPTISVLNKRVAEEWAMKRMENPLVQKIGRFLFRI